MTAPTERTGVLLSALGSTADEIAASLAAAGATGWPCDSDACVLATYLRWHGVPVVVVDPESPQPGTGGVGHVYFPQGKPYAMSPAVSEFGQRFDSEQYPTLVGSPNVAAPTQSSPTERS